MQELKKIVARQDADFKLSPSSSNETSINLSNEISNFISNASGEVRFKIFKSELIKAISALCLLPNVYYKKEKEPSSIAKIFTDLYQQVVNQFGDSSFSFYNINILKRDDGRAYFNGLKKDNGFNFRSFLVEQYSEITFSKGDDGIFSMHLNTYLPLDDVERKEVENVINEIDFQPLQQIVFGAPGTGKSHGINSNANISESNSIRTTFHPDSDYSSFVGCYKPTKKEKRSIIIPSAKLIEDAKSISGVANQVKYLCDNADSFINAANELNISWNKLIWESFKWHNETYFVSFLELIQKERADFGGEITYEFCPQAFTNAYVNAWKNLDEPYYLIIEEINRGNCAQIFGDIFQLLDRDENGFSSYKITPDQDLANYLRAQFDDADIDDADIKSGCKMQLPNNLHIWATMNTSDQSLFPIDSAFKRRWDWKYMPIDYTNHGHYISCDDKKYSWSDFLEKVNEHIESTTQSEDKKLGYWFLARKDHNEITTELFVSKVIFYLWNDIFKDFATAGNSIFKDEYSKFHKFFDNQGDAKSDVVKKFLDNLGVSFTSHKDGSENSANNDTAEVEA